MKLSPTMEAALAACKAAGSLWRWQGGYWVAEPPAKHVTTKYVTPPRDVPTWGRGTIDALISRGMVEVAESRTTFGGSSFTVRVAPVKPASHIGESGK